MCVGDIALLECSVTGTDLFWLFGESVARYNNATTGTQPFGPFTANLISICDGNIVTSNATVNVSGSVVDTVNGSIIQCISSSALTEPSNFTINVKSKSSHYIYG